MIGSENNSEIVALEDRADSLAKSLGSYNPVRARDQLGTATDADQVIICSGNATAHGGDAVVDAQLYEGASGRRDIQVFPEPYGLDLLLVLTISEFFTVNHSYCRLILGCSSSNWFRSPGHHCCVKQTCFSRFFGQENARRQTR